MNCTGLFVLVLVSNVHTLLGQDTLRYTAHHPFRLETVAGTEVCVSNRSNVALIVSNGIACGACHTVIEEAVQALDSTFSIIVGVVTRSNSSISRRESVQWVKRLVQTPEIYLLYQSDYSNNCTPEFTVDTTLQSPFLLVLRNGSPTATVPYHDLFLDEDNTLPSVEQVKTRIAEFMSARE